MIDPAGGSWYVESLTEQLGQAAWSMFQELESHGGMSGSLKAEIPQSQIHTLLQTRTNNLAKRKDVLVGTNMYVNRGENPLVPDEIDYRQLHTDRAQFILERRDESQNCVKNLQSGSSIHDLVNAAKEGATLEQMGQATSAGNNDHPIIVPLRATRLSEPFEQLRHHANSFEAQHGHAPQIFLATMGIVAQHKARADFSTGFFEVGGFELLRHEGQGYATPDEAVQAALESGAGALVICATDAMYQDIVSPLTKQIKEAKPDMVVVLAGYPKEQIDAYRSAGVDAFIHVRADCYAENMMLQEKLGVWS
mgnify:CR=1 FL=1